MLLLAALPPMSVAAVALLDATLLSMLTFPVLRRLAFEPLVRSLRARASTERALVDLNRTLEQRVRDRTDELQQSHDSLVAEVANRERVQQERERLISKLQQALSEVKQLSGLLPICSACKKTRDDHGYWVQVEAYIEKHSNARCTHSLCPECIPKYFPGYLPPPPYSSANPEPS